jgi:hypothetical protein
MPQADPPVRTSDVLGRITAIRRNGLLIRPARKLSPFRLIFARILGSWDFCQAIVLRLHVRRKAGDSGFDFQFRKASL